MRIEKRRKRERKTDYRLRIGLLKSGKLRAVFRKSNKYIIGQIIKSEEGQDIILLGSNSKELIIYGWPKEQAGSLKSHPACYLTGYLLGKKSLKKIKGGEFILDIGMIKHIPKSKVYSFLRGIIDSGIPIKSGKEVFPEKNIIKGENTKVKGIFDKVKENIEKEI